MYIAVLTGWEEILVLLQPVQVQLHLHQPVHQQQAQVRAQVPVLQPVLVLRQHFKGKYAKYTF